MPDSPSVTRPRALRSPPGLSATAIVLAFAAGATDAFAFLLLGGVFTANMTGNLVLAGLFQRAGYATMIVGIVVVIVVFSAGLFAALRFTRTGARRRQVGVLAIAAAAQAAVLVGWLLLPDRTATAQVVLLAFSAVAMAAQTAVARRVEARSGVTTTYVTGTITALAADLADGVPQDLVTRVGVVVALVVGALCGALAIAVDGALGAAVPLVPSLVGMILLSRAPQFSDEPAGRP